MKNASVTCTEHRRSGVAVVPGYTTTADRNECIGWLNFARNDGNEDNDDSRHSVPRRLSVTAQRIWWPRHRRIVGTVREMYHRPTDMSTSLAPRESLLTSKAGWVGLRRRWV